MEPFYDVDPDYDTYNNNKEPVIETDSVLTRPLLIRVKHKKGGAVVDMEKEMLNVPQNLIPHVLELQFPHLEWITKRSKRPDEFPSGKWTQASPPPGIAEWLALNAKTQSLPPQILRSERFTWKAPSPPSPSNNPLVLSLVRPTDVNAQVDMLSSHAWNEHLDDAQQRSEINTVIGAMVWSKARKEVLQRQRFAFALKALERAPYLKDKIYYRIGQASKFSSWTNLCQDAIRYLLDRTYTKWWHGIGDYNTVAAKEPVYFVEFTSKVDDDDDDLTSLVYCVFSLGYVPGDKADGIKFWGGTFMRLHVWAPSLLGAFELGDQRHKTACDNAFAMLLDEMVPKLLGVAQLTMIYFHDTQLATAEAVAHYINERKTKDSGPFIRQSSQSRRQADDDIYKRFELCFHPYWL